MDDLATVFRKNLRAEHESGEMALAAAIGETLLGHERPLAEDLERTLLDEAQTIRGRNRRDPLGFVPTPGHLAQDVAERVQDRLGDREMGAIVDPAVGTGRLLLPFVADGSEYRCMGLDIDAVPLAVAQHNLGDAVELRQEDTLLRGRPVTRDERLTIVCNPPWVKGFSRQSLRSLLDVDVVEKAAGTWSRGGLSLAIAFVAKVVRDWLSDGEIGLFIVPDALCHGSKYEVFRRELLQHARSLKVHYHDDGLFKSRTVRAVVLEVERNDMPWSSTTAATCDIELVEHAAEPVRRLQTRAEDIERLPWAVLSAPSAATDIAIGLLRADVPTLGELVDIADGINTGPRDARDALLSEEPLGMSKPRRAVEGSHVKRDRVVAADARWIETDREAIKAEWKSAGTSLRRKGLFDGPCIYSRQTTGRLTTAVSNDQSVALNSVHIIKLKADTALSVGDTMTLRIVSWILNTPVVSEVYRALFGENRRVFPQVKIECLRRLPFPWPPPPELLRAFIDQKEEHASSDKESEIDARVREWWTAEAQRVL
jgi:predicted RNA methylase